MLADFKDFLMKGNLVTLAVAFVIGLAFASVVTAFVEDIVTPIIAAIGGQPDFSALDVTVNGSVFRYGLFLNALIAFIVVAAILFFLVVRPYNRLSDRYAKEDPSTKDCPECRSTIPVAATRCAFCTTTV
jgi:large conductance mechanosensitive channel